MRFLIGIDGTRILEPNISYLNNILKQYLFNAKLNTWTIIKIKLPRSSRHPRRNLSTEFNRRLKEIKFFLHSQPHFLTYPISRNSPSIVKALSSISPSDKRMRVLRNNWRLPLASIVFPAVGFQSLRTPPMKTERVNASIKKYVFLYEIQWSGNVCRYSRCDIKVRWKYVGAYLNSDPSKSVTRARSDRIGSCCRACL